MPETHVTCDKCGSWAIITSVEGALRLRPTDPPPKIIITILCPKCGVLEQKKQPHEV